VAVPKLRISKEASVKIPRAIGLVLILHFGLEALGKLPPEEPAPVVKYEIPAPPTVPTFEGYRHE
jgi:hypothetical protein